MSDTENDISDCISESQKGHLADIKLNQFIYCTEWLNNKKQLYRGNDENNESKLNFQDGEI